MCNGATISRQTVDLNTVSGDNDWNVLAGARDELERGHGHKQSFDNPLGVENVPPEYEL